MFGFSWTWPGRLYDERECGTGISCLYLQSLYIGFARLIMHFQNFLQGGSRTLLCHRDVVTDPWPGTFGTVAIGLNGHSRTLLCHWDLLTDPWPCIHSGPGRLASTGIRFRPRATLAWRPLHFFGAGVPKLQQLPSLLGPMRFSLGPRHIWTG